MILITFAIDKNYNNQQITVTYSASAQILSHRAVDSLYSYIVYLETEYALDNDNLVCMGYLEGSMIRTLGKYYLLFTSAV